MIERDILSSIWCYCNIELLVQQRMGEPIEAKNIIDKSKGRKIQFISTQIHIWQLPAFEENWASNQDAKSITDGVRLTASGLDAATDSEPTEWGV